MYSKNGNCIKEIFVKTKQIKFQYMLTKKSQTRL